MMLMLDVLLKGISQDKSRTMRTTRAMHSFVMRVALSFGKEAIGTDLTRKIVTALQMFVHRLVGNIARAVRTILRQQIV
jgi:hypothetical protein